MAEIWNEGARERVRHGLVEGGESYADAMARKVITVLDDYARVWSEEDNAACREDAEGYRQAARRACLRARRRRFEALIVALPQVDAKGRRRAVAAAAGLPLPSDCVSAEPGPEDSDAGSPARASIERRIDALTTSVALAQYGRAKEQVAWLERALAAGVTPGGAGAGGATSRDRGRGDGYLRPGGGQVRPGVGGRGTGFRSTPAGGGGGRAVPASYSQRSLR